MIFLFCVAKVENFVYGLLELCFKRNWLQRETVPPRLWKGNSWTQISPNGTVPSARYGHSAVLTAAGDGFFVFGGRGSSGGLGHFRAIFFVWWFGGIFLLAGRGYFNDLHMYSVQVREIGDFTEFDRNSIKQIRSDRTVDFPH